MSMMAGPTSNPTPSSAEQDTSFTPIRGPTAVSDARVSSTPSTSTSHPSSTRPPLGNTQHSNRRASPVATTQRGSENVLMEGAGPRVEAPSRLSQEAVGRWSSALGNLQDLGKVVDGLAKTLESAVYLDDSEYSIQAQLQHYKNTLKVTRRSGQQEVLLKGGWRKNRGAQRVRKELAKRICSNWLTMARSLNVCPACLLFVP